MLKHWKHWIHLKKIHFFLYICLCHNEPHLLSTLGGVQGLKKHGYVFIYSNSPDLWDHPPFYGTKYFIGRAKREQ